MSLSVTAHRANYSPFMVVNAGETLPQAIERHVRDTGHRGPLTIVAWTHAPQPLSNTRAAA